MLILKFLSKKINLSKLFLFNKLSKKEINKNNSLNIQNNNLILPKDNNNKDNNKFFKKIINYIKLKLGPL